MLNEKRLSRYMKEKTKEIQARLRGIATVYQTGFSVKERRPNGVYRTNKAFTGAAENSIGMKVVDCKVDGTLYLSIKYEPRNKARAEAALDGILHPGSSVPEQAKYDCTYIDSQVSRLLSDAECVRRVRKGPVVAGSSYPIGINVLRGNPKGIEAVLADEGAYMPVFIEPHPGMGEKLSRKYTSRYA